MRQPVSKQPGASGDNRGPQPPWQSKALCLGQVDADYDPWDADPNVTVPSRTADYFCQRCPVRRECLLAGLASDQLNGGVAFGIWGGLSPRQRRALVRIRYRQGCPVCGGKLLIAPEGEEWQVCASCAVTWRARKRLPID